MAHLLLLVPVGLVTLLPALGGNGPFAELSFEQACVKAGESEKLVLVYFSEADNEQCASFEASTWPDEKVGQWLGEHAVAIELDAPSHGELVNRFEVAMIPAVVLVSSSGEVRGKVQGFRRPASLLQELERGLQALDPLEQARRRMETADDQPAARIAYAKALEEAGKPAEALEQYLICFDKTPDTVEHSLGVRLLAAEELGRLAGEFPPARKALLDRRDQVRGRVLEQKSERGDPQLLAVLNARLDQVEDTLAVYRVLQQKDPTSITARLVRDSAVDSLIELKRYKDACEIIDVVAQFRLAYDQHKEDVSTPLDKDRMAEFRRFLRSQFLRANIRFYEVLIGADRQTEASEVAKAFLEVDSSASTFVLLASAGLRTGRPVEANLSQARQAVALLEKADFEALCTLTKLLVHFEKHDEAKEVVERYGSKLENAEEQARLRKLLDR